MPLAKIKTLAASLRRSHGRAQAVIRIEAQSPIAGTAHIAFAAASATAELAIEPAPPHRITGLVLTDVAATAPSLATIAAAIRALPGETAFIAAELGGAAPRVLAAHAPERVLAVGSTFKLVVLAELVRSLNAGERRWADVVMLGPEPLPRGALHRWPPDAPVTLHTLAGLMISTSDNSATDALLRALGRERVEAMLPVVGIADPARDRPLLSTLDAFKLKGAQRGVLGDRWGESDEAGRRALLDELAAVAPAAIDQTLLATPNRIGSVEWFASPADLVRVTDWLCRETESGPGAAARAILALNPGVGAGAAARWGWLGYKGGSEPGVLSMTFLGRTSEGAWRAASGSWNNPAATLDEARFLALMRQAMALLAG